MGKFTTLEVREQKSQPLTLAPVLISGLLPLPDKECLICITRAVQSFNWNDNRIAIPFSYLLELLHHQTLIQISMRIEHCRLVILGDGLNI